MEQQMKLNEVTRQLLRCPSCGAELGAGGGVLRCQQCSRSYPVVEGVPVLIDDSCSVFSVEDFLQPKRPDFNDLKKSWKNNVRSLLPKISRNIHSEEHYGKFLTLLKKESANPRVLVIGSGLGGSGTDAVISDPAIELVASDVSFGPLTSLICDAHQIPFAEKSFDGIIVQGVLEHVVDPYLCVNEMYRTLKPHGLVYAETPFIQQVHGGRYDFTRFTHLGHRRLFKNFEEAESGAVCGPGMALAWSYAYFLGSFATSRMARSFLTLFARLTSFWLTYFDYFLVNKPGALDAASGYYFIGKKSETAISDKQLIQLYRGLVGLKK